MYFLSKIPGVMYLFNITLAHTNPFEYQLKELKD